MKQDNFPVCLLVTITAGHLIAAINVRKEVEKLEETEPEEWKMDMASTMKAILIVMEVHGRVAGNSDTEIEAQGETYPYEIPMPPLHKSMCLVELLVHRESLCSIMH